MSRPGPAKCKECLKPIRICVRAECGCGRWIHIKDDCQYGSNGHRADPGRPEHEPARKR